MVETIYLTTNEYKEYEELRYKIRISRSTYEIEMYFAQAKRLIERAKYRGNIK